MDWADRESTEAAIRRKIKRLLRKHDYQPPPTTASGGGAARRQPLHASSCSTRRRRSIGTGRKSRIGCSLDRGDASGGCGERVCSLHAEAVGVVGPHFGDADLRKRSLSLDVRGRVNVGTRRDRHGEDVEVLGDASLA